MQTIPPLAWKREKRIIGSDSERSLPLLEEAETLIFRKGSPPPHPHARGRQKRSHVVRSQEIPAPFRRGGGDATPPLQARKDGPTSQESQPHLCDTPCLRRDRPGGGEQASSRPDRPPQEEPGPAGGGPRDIGGPGAPPRALPGRKREEGTPPRPPRGSFGPRGPRRGRRAREETMKRRFLEGEAASPGQEGPGCSRGGGGGACRSFPGLGWVARPIGRPQERRWIRARSGEKNTFPPFRGLSGVLADFGLARPGLARYASPRLQPGRLGRGGGAPDRNSPPPHAPFLPVRPAGKRAPGGPGRAARHAGYPPPPPPPRRRRFPGSPHKSKAGINGGGGERRRRGRGRLLKGPRAISPRSFSSFFFFFLPQPLPPPPPRHTHTDN